MKRVIAAIDQTPAARSVLVAGRALAQLLGAELEAISVREDGSHTAQRAAAAARVKLREVVDPVVQTLVSEASGTDVVALVLGARSTPAGRRPAGHVAIQVIAGCEKPVLVVPPEARIRRRFERLLVPLDGSWSSARALAGSIEQACRAGLDVVILHVLDEGSLPPFSDQPHHEAEAWIDEFLARFCPVAETRAELRFGIPAHAVASVAEELGADLIALSWSQDLAEGRASVVREVLERGRSAVLLVPAPTGSDVPTRTTLEVVR
jgi:nucleotide-binding universal stress UspA family protein